MTQTPPSPVLDGITVIDFGRYVAGPFCAALLADFGARVIRVEKVGGGDDRSVVPVTPDGDGALYLQVNRNKQGMTLDPSQPAGRDVLARLVAKADVVVANLPPRALVTLGLDYDALRAIKPDIILTTVTAFGPGGPLSDKLGFDGIGQAMSGAIHLAGSPEQPARSLVPYVDYCTASLSAFGTVMALMARGKSGTGQVVDASLLLTSLSIANYALVEQAITAPDRAGLGNRGFASAPNDVFRTNDGWVIVQSVGDAMFKRWAELTGNQELIDDPRFANDVARAEHGEVVSARMTDWTKPQSTAAVLDALEQARIPSGPVYAPQQALDDPHIATLGYLTEIDYPGLTRPAPIADTPVKLSATPGGIRNRAPQLGEHTDSILAELGFNRAEIEQLRAARII